MIAVGAARAKSCDGLRLFSMPRDLLELANLIELTFQSELDHSGYEIVAEFRRLAALPPVLWLLEAFNRSAFGVMGGYVWIADGRLVGNATLIIEDRARGLWSVSNVAVHPSFRGHGIARQLMEASVRQARDKGAQSVLLEVQTANAPAQHLYRDLGFRVYDTIAEVTLLPSQWPGSIAPPCLPLRKRVPDDWQGLYDLLAAATPAGAKEVRPIQPQQYRLGIERRLQNWANDLLAVRQTSDLVFEQDARIAALLHITGHYTQATHRLQLVVHPASRGTVEPQLVAAGLSKLAGFPARTTASTVSTSHQQALDAFRASGFTTTRVLDQMRLDLHNIGSMAA